MHSAGYRSDRQSLRRDFGRTVHTIRSSLDSDELMHRAEAWRLRNPSWRADRTKALDQDQGRWEILIPSNAPYVTYRRYPTGKTEHTVREVVERVNSSGNCLATSPGSSVILAVNRERGLPVVEVPGRDPPRRESGSSNFSRWLPNIIPPSSRRAPY